MALESAFQAKLIRKLKRLFPGCHVLKLDSGYQQGIPDLLILFHDKWAILEVKRREPRSERDWEPNQEWFIEEFNSMSFSACVYPENVEDVLYGLQQALHPGRSARRA